MREQFRTYIVSLYQNIPTEVYEGLLSVFCLGLVVFSAWKGFKTGLRYSAVLLLVEYIFLLFCSTVIFRTSGDTREYDFHPFWSYSRPDLFVENLMNVGCQGTGLSHDSRQLAIFYSKVVPRLYKTR